MRLRYLHSALIALALCGIVPGALQAADQESFDDALAVALAAQEKAASVSGEWRDVGQFLKDAQEKAAAGDFAGAIALAKKAEHQSLRGYEQMTSQAGKVGLDPYLQ